MWLQKSGHAIDFDRIKHKAAAAAIAFRSNTVTCILAIVLDNGDYFQAKHLEVNIPNTQTFETEHLFKDAEKMVGRSRDLLHRPALGFALEAPRKKLGRNEPCYCGSGMKYKKCHGR